jgi:hypothetical protein
MSRPLTELDHAVCFICRREFKSAKALFAHRYEAPDFMVVRKEGCLPAPIAKPTNR